MTSAAWTVPAGGWWLRARRWCGRAWSSRLLRLGRPIPRRLRLQETLALGERRFVAVLEFDGARFLLGGTASSLVLLARLRAQRPRDQEEQGTSDPEQARVVEAAKAAEAGRS